MIKKIKEIFNKRCAEYPNSARVVYIVRDDDRFFVDLWDNAWCTDRVIKAVKAFDKIFLDRNIPVTVGVVPKSFDDRTIGQEEELVEYLRHLKKQGWEIAQHGNTHAVFTDYSREKQKAELIEGKQLLENLFGEIVTFIPPKNVWDKTLLSSLSKLGYSSLSVGLTEEPKKVFVKRSLSIFHIALNSISDYRKGTVKDSQEINKVFDEYYSKGCLVFCNMFHSWIYDSNPSKLKEIERHLDYIKTEYGDDVWFTTIKDFTNFLKKKNYT